MTDDDMWVAPSCRHSRDDDGESVSLDRTSPRVHRARNSTRRDSEPLASPSFAAWFDDAGVGASTDIDADLVDLGFFRVALRRSRRLWAGLAVLGFLLGVAFWATHPPTAQASTTLRLNVGSEGQAGTAILNDRVMAQSRGVAKLARDMLNLRQSVESLQSTYTATVLTDQVLLITASAPSTSQAITRANAIASAFLTFRKNQLAAQQNLYFASLDDTVSRRERQLKAIQAHVSEVAGQPASNSQQALLSSLREARDRAKEALTVLKNEVDTAKASSEDTTAAMEGQSGVLDAASAVPQSRMKPLLIFSGAGAVIGLFLGAAFIVIRALISDQLRRRDDVARALGAPVRLSTPSRRRRRLPLGRRHNAADRQDIQHIVAFLRDTMPTTERSPCALALVPVDDTRVAALCVMSLAASFAKQDARVVVADLCSGAPAARLAGVRDPGLHTVHVDGAQVDVAIPDPDDIAPVGPFNRPEPLDQGAPIDQIAAAGASADVLLTLIALDPSLASDHLRTWTAEAIVLVTAGRSSWTKIHAVGELIRLAGAWLTSAVLIGADKWDESLGVAAARGARRDAASSAAGSTVFTSYDAPPTSTQIGR